MSILVTGGLGYIGSHTVIELLEEGYEVVIVDNLYNSQLQVLDRIHTITGKSVTFYREDVLDKIAMQDIFNQHDIHAVIHFAAYKAVGESVAQPLKYYENNVYGLVSLLEVMQEAGVKRLIYSSSATVYGDANPVPFDETMPTASASNPYGTSKIFCEKILSDLVVADNDWSVVVLRYFNPIGAHESGIIGEDPHGVPNNLMPYITQVAVGKLEKLSVYGDDYPTPDGTGVRDYIHVVDLAKGHVKALDQTETTSGESIYNLGTGQGYSVLDLLKAFEEVSGQTIPYQIQARRPGDIATSYADVTKSQQELGWVAERNLRDMCRDSWRWQSQNKARLA